MELRLRMTRGTLTPVGEHAREWLSGCTEGEIVFADMERARSAASHRHQWAWLHEAWKHLPEAMADESFARSSEALRKHALIETGFCNCETLTFASTDAADKAAPFMLRLATQAHGYARAEIDGKSVRVWTPHSQSQQAMGGARFQQSKTAVLEWVARLIDVEPGQLLSEVEA
jgi:hypothetical protein